MLEIVKRALRGAGCGLIALVVLSTLAFAQAEVKKSPFGVGPAPAATAQDRAVSSGGWWSRVVAIQHQYTRDLTNAVRDLKTANPMAAAATLAWISFAYGVLHAAGPGHGKAIISSYVLANRQTMRRGIFLSFLSAFFQACSAIILVGILALLIKATSIQIKSAEAWIETISWALVALLGCWILYRQVKPFMAGWSTYNYGGLLPQIAQGPRLATAPGGHAHVHGPGCGHDHHDRAVPVVAHVHGPGCNHGHDHAHVVAAPVAHVHGPGCNHGHDAHGHAPVAAHVHDANCGHVHMPEPSQLEGPWSWPKALSLALSVGIRPCTGAIMVMLFALSQGLLWAGIFATFVMSFGTALTVSALAVLAVGSRDVALRWAGRDSLWAERLELGVGVLGALLVTTLGTIGFLASLQAPSPF